MTDTLFDIVIRTSKTTNTNMKFYRKTLNKMSDMDIRQNYKENGENMFEPFKELLKNYKNDLIPNNLESIAVLREINDPNQIKKLNECEKLAEESLKIIDEILKIFQYIMKHKLNNAIIGTLEGKTRDIIKKHNIKPTNPREKVVLDQPYSKGGFRNRKNNNKYTKNRRYKLSKKYISNKNKTQKIKNNYLDNFIYTLEDLKWHA
jgi:hypothetical protein